MLIFTILTPVVLGAFIPFIRFKDRKQMNMYSLLSSILTSLLVFWLVFVSAPSEKLTLFHITAALPISFGIDGLGKLFLLIISVLWPLTTLYAGYYMEHYEKQKLFFCFFTICYGISLGIASSANLITLYMFYELLTLITLPLVMHDGKPTSIKAGLRYMYFSLGGTALAFIGLMYIISYSPDMQDFIYGGIFTWLAPSNSLRFAYLLFFLGFGVKAAVFPMHSWLPMASVAPTPVTALLHAVAVVKSGVFAIMRITWYIFGVGLIEKSFAQYIPLLLAAFTIVYGSILSVKEQNIKRRLAYSTVSNLSYIVLSVLLLNVQGFFGAMQHMVYHALMKISLFMASGVYLLHGASNIRQIKGAAKSMPFTSAAFMLCALAIAGIPPLLGFQSKWTIGLASLSLPAPYPVIAVISLLISAILTCIYLVVPAFNMYFGKPSEGIELHEKDMRALAPIVFIAALALVISLAPQSINGFLSQIANGTM